MIEQRAESTHLKRQPTRRRSVAGSVGSVVRNADLLLALAFADMRARYGRDPLRFLKWMLDSMALVGVYLILRTVLLGRGGEAPGLSLACAVVPFHLMMMTVFSSMTTVQQRRSIILNVGFKRILLPASSAFTEAIAFAGGLVLIFILMAVYSVAPTVAILWLPVVVAVTVAFTTAVAYASSLFGLWFPEWGNIARSLVRMSFFLAPGIITLSEIPAGAQGWVKLNPLTGIFEAYRDVVLYGSSPAAWELLYPLAFAAVLLAITLPIYRREQWHLAKVV